MSNSNTFFLLTRVQHLQRYAKVLQIIIDRTPCVGVRVELIKYRPTKKSVFNFVEHTTDEENEKEYQRLLNVYERYER